jgi:hypothetical protein
MPSHHLATQTWTSTTAPPGDLDDMFGANYGMGSVPHRLTPLETLDDARVR